MSQISDGEIIDFALPIDRMDFLFDFFNLCFGKFFDLSKIDRERPIMDWIVDVVHLVDDWF